MGDNTNAPVGLQPLQLGPKYMARWYRLTNNYGTAVYVGDPAANVTAGSTELATAAGGNVVLGGIVAIAYNTNTSATALYRPENLAPVAYMAASPGASYTYWVLVADEVDQVFFMQEDSDTTPIQIADNYGNCDLVAGTGSTTTGLSGWMLDSSSAADTSTLQMRLIQPVPFYDLIAGQYNQIYDGTDGDYCKWHVTINVHQRAARTAGLA